MYKIVVIFVLCVFCVGSVFATGQSEDAMDNGKMDMMHGGPFTLTLLHNNDGESALTANDYSGSVAQFAYLTQSIVNEVGKDYSLVVSAGDNFLAGTEYAASQGVFDALALNFAGFEVSALGNHEFDFGPAGLARFMEVADFVFVNSNLDLKDDRDLGKFVGTKVFPYTTLQKGGNTIGLIGATTEQISYISSPGEDIAIHDVEQSLQKSVDELTKKGVQIIIALTHLQNVDEEKALAEKIDGVDIFVAGGGDNLLGNANNEYLTRVNREGDMVVDTPEEPYPYRTTSPSGDPVLVVATDGGYNYLGRLTVSFDEHGVVDSVDEAKSGPIGVSPDLPADIRTQLTVVDIVEKDIAGFAEQVVGVVTNGLDGTRNLVRTQETTMGNAISDAYLDQSRAEGFVVDFAFTNGGGIRGSVVVPANEPVTMADILTALPFPNYLTVINGLSVAQIKDIFEHSVSQLPEAGGNFLQVAGIFITYDSSAAVGERVSSIKIGTEMVYSNGRSLSNKRYAAVTNSFVADGGDNYQTLSAISQDDKVNIGISYAEGLERYLRTRGTITVSVGGRLEDVAN